MQRHRDTQGGGKKRGRPLGHGAVDPSRAARNIAIYRAAGFPDETILGGIASHLLPSAKLSSRDRRRAIRKTLNRWEGPLRRDVGEEDAKANQALAYALGKLGDEWVVEPQPDETPAKMRATAQQLEHQAAAVAAAQRAGSFAVPAPRDQAAAEAYRRELVGQAAKLRERAEEKAAANRVERERPVSVRHVDPADARRPDFDAFGQAA